MSTEVAPPNADELELLQGMYPKALPHHLKHLWLIGKRRALDPLMKQIVLQLRWNKDDNRHDAALVTSIDAFRLKAAATGQYAGSDDYEYEEADGAKRPTKARCTVYRLVGGVRCPYTSTVRWSEFGSEKGTWPKMPFHMLGKCAEALALRKAFPEELAGLLTDDETSSAAGDAVANAADTDAAAKTVAPKPDKLAEELKAAAAAPKQPVNPRVPKALELFKQLGKDEAAVLKHLKLKSVEEITVQHLDSDLPTWYAELRRDKASENQERQ